MKFCDDIHSALTAVLPAYDREQIVAVMDSKLDFETGFPTLRVDVCEQNKSLETAERIWQFLFDRHITRRGLVIAVGGGVLTDMTGFACATYKRGIGFVNIPTTLLAMIDASSGGKTAINYGGLKNSIGVFAPPVETLVCTKWLETLPAEQFLSGFGEMLKTGLIAPEEDRRVPAGRLWNRLLRYDLDTMDTGALRPLIADCLRVKEAIVAEDPKEQGLRKALNFGHTFGHALEELSISSDTPMLHGYAVLYGMIAELYLSVTRLGCSQEPLQQLTQLMLHHYGKPECKCSDRERLIALMQQDKKNEHAAQINCTLIRNIGSPVINQIVTPADAAEALDYLFSI